MVDRPPMMWHHPQFTGGCWDGSSAAAAAGTDVELGGGSSMMPADTTGATYNHHPASVYGCSFSGATTPGGAYVGGYDGTMAGSTPYYGMYSLPSLAAASPWSAASHTPSLGYNAVRAVSLFMGEIIIIIIIIVRLARRP